MTTAELKPRSPKVRKVKDSCQQSVAEFFAVLVVARRFYTASYTPAGHRTTSRSAGYEKLNWKTIFESFLGRQRSVIDKNPISYFGGLYGILFLQKSKPRRIRIHQAQEVWDHAYWILPLCDGLRQILDEILASITGPRPETEMEPLADDVDLNSFISRLEMSWSPTVAQTENDVAESLARGALLGKGEIALNMFNETDELLNELDVFSTLGM
ncbi:hypothetical protein V1517DRAFT_347313 [Lipomyces orientalis]|uniref:Uncharacterized protein n=1 Tax=Lipomyces orientalis TaxID=1233043 RepID=A0ACC3TKH6_9ASCO